jgi:hypothetical protein
MEAATGEDGRGLVHAAGPGRKRSSSSLTKSTEQQAAQKRPRKKSAGSAPVAGGGGPASEATEGARARARELVERREAMERNLVTLEQQIYALETSYLEDTHSRGNVLSGTHSSPPKAPTHHSRRSHHFLAMGCGWCGWSNVHKYIFIYISISL